MAQPRAGRSILARAARRQQIRSLPRKPPVTSSRFCSRLMDNSSPVNVLQSVFLMGAQRRRKQIVAPCACGAVSPERGEMGMKSRLPSFDPKLLAAIADGAKVYELSHAMAPS